MAKKRKRKHYLIDLCSSYQTENSALDCDPPDRIFSCLTNGGLSLVEDEKSDDFSLLIHREEPDIALDESPNEVFKQLTSGELLFDDGHISSLTPSLASELSTNAPPNETFEQLTSGMLSDHPLQYQPEIHPSDCAYDASPIAILPCATQESSLYTPNCELAQISSNLDNGIYCPPIAAPEPSAAPTQTRSYQKRTDAKLSFYEIAQRLLIKEVIRNIDGALHYRHDQVYLPLATDSVTSLMRRHLSENQLKNISGRDMQYIFDHLRGVEEIKTSRSELPADCALFENGFWDIRKRRKIECTASHLIFSRIHARFYPERCLQTSAFDRFTESQFGLDQECRQLLLCAIGDLLLADNRTKKIYILGPASNSGKSVLGQFIKLLVGKENVSAVAPHEMSESFLVASMFSKAINLCLDIGNGALSDKDVARLKRISGTDDIVINQKYIPAFSTVCTTKLLYGTNHPIRLSSNDPAFWERVVIIPMLRSIPEEERDHHLLEKLWDERDGIVTKAVLCARSMMLNNYILPHCSLSEKLKAQWSNSSDISLKYFVEECCEFGEYGVVIETRTLYEAYRDYCRINGFEPVSINTFSYSLRENYPSNYKRRADVRGFYGIRLK